MILYLFSSLCLTSVSIKKYVDNNFVLLAHVEINLGYYRTIDNIVFVLYTLDFRFQPYPGPSARQLYWYRVLFDRNKLISPNDIFQYPPMEYWLVLYPSIMGRPGSNLGSVLLGL